MINHLSSVLGICYHRYRNYTSPYGEVNLPRVPKVS